MSALLTAVAEQPLPRLPGNAHELGHPCRVLAFSWAVLYRTLQTFSPDTLVLRRAHRHPRPSQHTRSVSAHHHSRSAASKQRHHTQSTSRRSSIGSVPHDDRHRHSIDNTSNDDAQGRAVRHAWDADAATAASSAPPPPPKKTKNASRHTDLVTHSHSMARRGDGVERRTRSADDACARIRRSSVDRVTRAHRHRGNDTQARHGNRTDEVEGREAGRHRHRHDRADGHHRQRSRSADALLVSPRRHGSSHRHQQRSESDRRRSHRSGRIHELGTKSSANMSHTGNPPHDDANHSPTTTTTDADSTGAGAATSRDEKESNEAESTRSNTPSARRPSSHPTRAEGGESRHSRHRRHPREGGAPHSSSVVRSMTVPAPLVALGKPPLSSRSETGGHARGVGQTASLSAAATPLTSLAKLSRTPPADRATRPREHSGRDGDHRGQTDQSRTRGGGGAVGSHGHHSDSPETPNDTPGLSGRRGRESGSRERNSGALTHRGKCVTEVCNGSTAGLSVTTARSDSPAHTHSPVESISFTAAVAADDGETDATGDQFAAGGAAREAMAHRDDAPASGQTPPQEAGPKKEERRRHRSSSAASSTTSLHDGRSAVAPAPHTRHHPPPPPPPSPRHRSGRYHTHAETEANTSLASSVLTFLFPAAARPRRAHSTHNTSAHTPRDSARRALASEDDSEGGGDAATRRRRRRGALADVVRVAATEATETTGQHDTPRRRRRRRHDRVEAESDVAMNRHSLSRHPPPPRAQERSASARQTAATAGAATDETGATDGRAQRAKAAAAAAAAAAVAADDATDRRSRRRRLGGGGSRMPSHDLLQASLWRHLWRAAPVALLHGAAALRRQLAAAPLLLHLADVSHRARQLLRSVPLVAGGYARYPDGLAGPIDRVAGGSVVWWTEGAWARAREALMRWIDTIRSYTAARWSASTPAKPLSSSSSSSSSFFVASLTFSSLRQWLPYASARLLTARLVMQLLRNYLKGVVFMDDTVAALNLRSTTARRNVAGWLSRLMAHTVLDMTLMSLITALLCAQIDDGGGVRVVRTVAPDTTNRAALDAHGRTGSVGDGDVSWSTPSVTGLRTTVEGVLRGVLCSMAAAVVDGVVRPVLSQLAHRAVITLCEGFEYVLLRRYTHPPRPPPPPAQTPPARTTMGKRMEAAGRSVEREAAAESTLGHVSLGARVTAAAAAQQQQQTHQLHEDATSHSTTSARVPDADGERDEKNAGETTALHEEDDGGDAPYAGEARDYRGAAAAAAHRAVIRAILYRIVGGVVAQCVIEHPLGVLVELLRGRAGMHVTGLLTRYDMPEDTETLCGRSRSVSHDSGMPGMDGDGNAGRGGEDRHCTTAAVLERSSSNQSMDKKDALRMEIGLCDWRHFGDSLTQSSRLASAAVAPLAVRVLRWCGDVVHEEMATVWSSLEEVSGQAGALNTLRAQAREYVSAVSSSSSSSFSSASHRSAMAQSVELAARSLLACGPLFDGVCFSALDKLLSFYVAVWIRLRRQTATAA